MDYYFSCVPSSPLIKKINPHINSLTYCTCVRLSLTILFLLLLNSSFSSLLWSQQKLVKYHLSATVRSLKILYFHFFVTSIFLYSFIFCFIAEKFPTNRLIFSTRLIHLIVIAIVNSKVITTSPSFLRLFVDQFVSWHWIVSCFLCVWWVFLVWQALCLTMETDLWPGNGQTFGVGGWIKLVWNWLSLGLWWL